MVVNIIIGIVIGYVVLSLLIFLLQDYFFFRPEILPQHFKYNYPFPFDEVNFDMEDGGRINGIHFRVPNAKGVVFYFKGNSRSVKGWGKFARDFVSKGYDFFMVDYRGFGKSKGRRSESILFNDGQHVYKWLSNIYPEEQIVIYGRSFGSGVATRIASWNNPKLLILDSPYFSFLKQVKRFAFILPVNWILRYHIRTDQFIKKVTAPIFIFHGNKDRLIPYKHAQMLQKLVPENLKLIKITGGGHNNLPTYPTYHEHLYDILNEDTQFEKNAA